MSPARDRKDGVRGLAGGRIAQDQPVRRRRPRRTDRPLDLEPVDQRLRTREVVAVLHPEVFQHPRDRIGVFERQAGACRW